MGGERLLSRVQVSLAHEFAGWETTSSLRECGWDSVLFRSINSVLVRTVPTFVACHRGPGETSPVVLLRHRAPRGLQCSSECVCFWHGWPGNVVLHDHKQ